jgi:hypothetical protein
MQFAILLQAFNGGNFLSHHRAYWSSARAHRMAIQQYGASAALALSTSVFCAGEIQLIAQNVQERVIRRCLDAALCPIHNQSDSQIQPPN